VEPGQPVVLKFKAAIDLGTIPQTEILNIGSIINLMKRIPIR